jgi:predicted  nucleic acid-binding Zn-ribbon protein
MPFTFINDAELDRLTALNKKINEGISIESLRNNLADSERNIKQMESRIDSLRNNAIPDKDLFEVAERWYDSPSYKRNQDDAYILERHEYTSEKYYNQKRAFADNETEIAKIEKSISDERDKIKSTTETLTAFEDIMSMTYVQKLVEAEKNRIQAKKIGNGIKSADMSIAESQKIDEVVEKVVEAVEKKIVEPKPKPPRPPRR